MRNLADPYGLLTRHNVRDFRRFFSNHTQQVYEHRLGWIVAFVKNKDGKGLTVTEGWEKKERLITDLKVIWEEYPEIASSLERMATWHGNES